MTFLCFTFEPISGKHPRWDEKDCPEKPNRAPVSCPSSCNCPLEPRRMNVSFLFFLRYAGLSLLRPLPLWNTGSGRTGSAAMAHGPGHSTACGIFPDEGTNPCPLHRQADSQPLHHQGSPRSFLNIFLILYSNDCMREALQKRKWKQ